VSVNGKQHGFWKNFIDHFIGCAALHLRFNASRAADEAPRRPIEAPPPSGDAINFRTSTSSKSQRQFDIFAASSGSLRAKDRFHNSYNHGSEQRSQHRAMVRVGNFTRKTALVCLVPLRRGHSYSGQQTIVCTSKEHCSTIV